MPESLKRKPNTLALFFEDIEWALEKSNQGAEVSDEDEVFGAKDPGEKSNQGSEVSDEDEDSGARDPGEKSNQGTEVSGVDEDTQAKDQGEKSNQGAEVSDKDEDWDAKDPGEKSNQGPEVSDEDDAGTMDPGKKSDQGAEVSDEDDAGTKDPGERSNQGAEVSGKDEDSYAKSPGEKSNQGAEISDEDKDLDPKDPGEKSNQGAEVSDEDDAGTKDPGEKSNQGAEVSDEDDAGTKDPGERTNQGAEVSDEYSNTKDPGEKSNQGVEVSGKDEDSYAKSPGEKSNQGAEVSDEDEDSDSKDPGEKSNQVAEVSDMDVDWDAKDPGEKSNQGAEVSDEVEDSCAKNLGEKSNQVVEVSDEDESGTKDPGEKSNQAVKVSDEDEDSEAKDQSNQAKDFICEEKQGITKRKKYRILSDSENEGVGTEMHVKRIRLESKGDSVKNKVKLTENTFVVSDSENESTQSELFPLLSGKVKKICNLPESDTDDSDASENEQSRVVARDVNHRNIFVTCAEKSLYTKSGKCKKTDRKYNARHVCPFCNKMQSNFSHHINAKKYENKEEMKKINSIKDNNERKREIDRLRCKADHENNLKVLDEKKGEIILMRRLNAKKVESIESDDSNSDSEVFDVSRYGPCPKCFGWVLKKSLRRHANSCSAFTSEVGEIHWTNRALEVQSDMICGKIPCQASQLLVNEVFPIMRGDHVSEIAQNDELIINLGNQWMMRNRRNEIMRKYYTSTVMRLASKLKLACQKLSGTNLDMAGFLNPVHFETVLKAALSCCHIADDEENLKSPSNAIKLGFDIKRMVNGKLSKAIMADDQQLQKEATDFQRLMEIEWCLRVTKLARGILEERSYNKTNELPRPSDVKKLYEYLQDELNHIDLNDKSSNNYRQVAMLTLARLTLYNRRRCHEVQAMRLVSYAARTTGVDEIGLEVRKELTEFEQVLLTRQEVVVIRGKTGKGVPVILPPDVTEPMKFLTDTDVRHQAGKEKDNKYVFASRGIGVFRAYEAIREVSQSPKADLQMPDLIRTSNMRKYMATMLQVLDTTEGERQWVMDHLGHTMNVHRIHYRQTSDVLERVDVAKILLIQDLGLVSKYRGKRLQDIQIEDIFQDDEGQGTSLVRPEDSVQSPETQEVLTLASRMDESEDEVLELNQEESTDEEELNCRPKRKKPQNSTRQKWSNEEVAELHNLFEEDFRTNTLPGQKRIEKVMKKSKDNGGVIWKRKRDTIKKKLSNMMRRKEN